MQIVGWLWRNKGMRQTIIALLLLTCLAPALAEGRVALLENNRDREHRALIQREFDAAGVAVDAFTFPEIPQSVLDPGRWLEDDLEYFLRSLDDLSALLPRRVTVSLRQVAASERRYAAINLSQGLTRVRIYDTYEEVLATRDPAGDYAYDRLRREVYGPDSETVDAGERRRRLATYLDRWIERPGSPYQAEMRRYREVTQALWDSGTPVVVAAGNDQARAEDPAGAGLNLLAEGGVLVVGPSQTGSSQAVVVQDDRGTSFAAARVSAALAQCRNDYPELDSADLMGRARPRL